MVRRSRAVIISRSSLAILRSSLATRSNHPAIHLSLAILNSRDTRRSRAIRNNLPVTRLNRAATIHPSSPVIRHSRAIPSNPPATRLSNHRAIHLSLAILRSSPDTRRGILRSNLHAARIRRAQGRLSRAAARECLYCCSSF